MPGLAPAPFCAETKMFSSILRGAGNNSQPPHQRDASPLVCPRILPSSQACSTPLAPGVSCEIRSDFRCQIRAHPVLLSRRCSGRASFLSAKQAAHLLEMPDSSYQEGANPFGTCSRVAKSTGSLSGAAACHDSRLYITSRGLSHVLRLTL